MGLGQLFKTLLAFNVIIKTSTRQVNADYISKYTVIFVDKMRESFALQRILTFFNENNSLFVIFMFEI